MAHPNPIRVIDHGDLAFDTTFAGGPTERLRGAELLEKLVRELPEVYGVVHGQELSIVGRGTSHTCRVSGPEEDLHALLGAHAALTNSYPLRVVDIPAPLGLQQDTAGRARQRVEELCSDVATKVKPLSEHGISVRVGGGEPDVLSREGLLVDARTTDVEMGAYVARRTRAGAGKADMRRHAERGHAWREAAVHVGRLGLDILELVREIVESIGGKGRVDHVRRCAQATLNSVGSIVRTVDKHPGADAGSCDALRELTLDLVSAVDDWEAPARRAHSVRENQGSELRADLRRWTEAGWSATGTDKGGVLVRAPGGTETRLALDEPRIRNALLSHGVPSVEVRQRVKELRETFDMVVDSVVETVPTRAPRRTRGRASPSP